MPQDDRVSWSTLSEWLPGDLRISEGRHQSALSRRLEGTGGWIIEHPTIQGWMRGPPSLCMVEGGAGSGKTILCVAIIEHLIHTNNAVAYFYFDLREARPSTCIRLLASLILQLAYQLDPNEPPPPLAGLHQAWRERAESPPGEPQLKEAIQRLCKSSSRPFIILDALDECPDRDRSNVIDLIEELANTRRVCHILVSTQTRLALRRVAEHTVNLYDEQANIENDLREYIRRTLEMERTFQRWNPEVRRWAAENMYARIVNGFFWVQSQMDSLRECRSLKAVEASFTVLPRKVVEMYRARLERISKDKKEGVLQGLALVAFSERPVTLLELRRILSIKRDPTGSLLPRRHFIAPDPESIISLFGGLLYVYPLKYPYTPGPLGSLGVRLAHPTVKEFIEQEGEHYHFRGYSLREDDARRFIADCSMALLRRWMTSRVETGRTLGELNLR